MSDFQAQQPAPAPVPAAGKPEPTGLRGAFQDPSTLAATGLLIAVAFAIVAGMLNVISDIGTDDIKIRLTALTDTVDVGDVALLGVAILLLLLTPDPPGGVPRSLLMQFDAVLAGVITIFGVVRAIVTLAGEGDAIGKFASTLATLGVAIAAFTVAFYAAKESFIKEGSDASTM